MCPECSRVSCLNPIPIARLYRDLKGFNVRAVEVRVKVEQYARKGMSDFSICPVSCYSGDRVSVRPPGTHQDSVLVFTGESPRDTLLCQAIILIQPIHIKTL